MLLFFSSRQLGKIQDEVGCFQEEVKQAVEPSDFYAILLNYKEHAQPCFLAETQCHFC